MLSSFQVIFNLRMIPAVLGSQKKKKKKKKKNQVYTD